MKTDSIMKMLGFTQANDRTSKEVVVLVLTCLFVF